MSEAREWKPLVLRVALARRVLVVARTRREGRWAAYVDAVEGKNHDDEMEAVLKHGVKMLEATARHLFPRLADMPYAK
jgi:hypothetical protein